MDVFRPWGSLLQTHRKLPTMSNLQTPAVENLAAAYTQHEPKAALRPVAPRPPKVEESKLVSAYANFCRVTGTPEELVVDFGLNTQPIGASEEAIVASQRIVLNYFTANRLLQALTASVGRHEAVFGPIETNVVKRAECQ
jgi:hypothetical protein